jgi:hypothetical protein
VVVQHVCVKTRVRAIVQSKFGCVSHVGGAPRCDRSPQLSLSSASPLHLSCLVVVCILSELTTSFTTLAAPCAVIVALGATTGSESRRSVMCPCLSPASALRRHTHTQRQKKYILHYCAVYVCACSRRLCSSCVSCVVVLGLSSLQVNVVPTCR